MRTCTQLAETSVCLTGSHHLHQSAGCVFCVIVTLLSSDYFLHHTGAIACYVSSCSHFTSLHLTSSFHFISLSVHPSMRFEPFYRAFPSFNYHVLMCPPKSRRAPPLSPLLGCRTGTNIAYVF
ncbi:hypothetical protein TRVL_03598 [Trypanosoma vivax]|nr:hypothetical protein TRVL_03598 [Trypanosoma vivax]